ncbi:hypothetical protein [Bradyrhizobium sp. dw_78]|uniref:hypothetical protein n=1 Tax=Bradyrhizobium sp. dw_78 TaxID=2719793 RepID=UPI001BD562DF|nr:hypothetical protein [Bradyrhizobium sp. dw_78]
MNRRGGSASRVWRWPMVLAVLTVFGLLSALLGQGGIWWALSWAALASPLVVILACVWMRRRAVVVADE